MSFNASAAIYLGQHETDWRRGPQHLLPGVYTGGRLIVAFEASRISAARQIRKESWLLDDSAILKSGGAALRAAQSKLSVRPATSEEITVFEQAAPEPCETVLVFLVELDGG